MEPAQYLVLDSPIPIESLQLGSLITNFERPTDDFLFSDALASQRQISKREDYNVEEIMTNSSNGGNILNKLTSRSKHPQLDKKTRLSSVRCGLYELMNVALWFQRLCDVAETRDWLLKHRKYVYLLVGYRTMQDGILEKEESSSTSISVGVDLSLTGLPVSFDYGSRRSTGNRSSYRTEKEAIFAVSYRRVKLRKFGLSKDVSLQSKKSWLGLRKLDIGKNPNVDRHHKVEDGFATKLLAENPSVSRSTTPINLANQSSIQGTAVTRQEPRFTIASSGVEPAIWVLTSQADVEKDSRVGLHELVADKEDHERMMVLEDMDTEHLDSGEDEMELRSSASDNPLREAGTKDDNFTTIRAIVRRLLVTTSIAPYFAAVTRLEVPYDEYLDHLRSCLVKFSLDLRIKAQSPQEKLAAEFLGYYYNQIATLLTKTIYAADEHEQTDPDSSIRPHPWDLDRQLDLLDDYEKPIPLEAFEADSSYEAFAGSESQRSDFRRLDILALDDFLFQGKPIDEMRKHLEISLYPKALSSPDARESRTFRTFFILTVVLSTIVYSLMLPGTLAWRTFWAFLFVLLQLVFFRVLEVGANILAMSEISVQSLGSMATGWAPLVAPLVLYEQMHHCSYRTSFVGHVERLPQVVWTPRKVLYSLLSSVQAFPLDKILQQGAVYLKRRFRPALKQGFHRVEWICECGAPLYGDFKMIDEEMIEADQESQGASHSATGDIPSEDITSQYQGDAQSSQTATLQARTSGLGASSSTPLESASSTLTRRKSIDNPKNAGKWFELCINYGLERKRLGEISLTGIENDTQLFQAIKARYESVRASRIKDLYLITAVDIQYVQFCLEDRYQVVVHNKPDSWPPKEETGWEWDQPPVRPTLGPPPISAETFLHYLRDKKAHREAKWLKRIVKKLDKSMTEEATDMPIGWGILIVEGLNRRVAARILWLSVFAVFAAGTIWSVWKQNGQSVGSFALAALALAGSFITSKFYEHIEA